MYLENLDEFINDEGRIVTYKWLSLTLGVHTNVAKQMLYHFVSSQHDSDKGDNLNVTYIVSGVVAREGDHPGVHKIWLVKEDSLAAAKTKMKDVISVHIYSVQKTKLQDMNVLYSANYDKVKENIMSINKYSGIECPDAKVRSTAALAKIRQENAYQAPPEPVKKESKYKPSQIKNDIKKEPGSENDDKQTNGKSNQIASMFARQNKKVEVKKEGAKHKKTPSSAGSKTKGGISAFFNKGPVVKKSDAAESVPLSPSKTSPSKSESSKCSPIKSGSGASSPVKADSIVSSSSETELQESVKESQVESVDTDSSPKRAKKQSKIKAQQQRGKNKRKKGKCDEAPKMKRTRIMQLSDSESSSEEEVEEELFLSPSPPPPEVHCVESDSDEIIPPTPQPKSQDLLNKGGQGRRRKLVDKTFEDEDGYIVTKKEYEFVEDSGDEDVAEMKMDTSPKFETEISPGSTKTSNLHQSKTKTSPQKKSTKATKKSQVADHKKKQSNITNFFSKK